MYFLWSARVLSRRAFVENGCDVVTHDDRSKDRLSLLSALYFCKREFAMGHKS